MKNYLLVYLFIFSVTVLYAQDENLDAWLVQAEDIDASEYYGVTSGNGMIGLVSSHEPLKVSEIGRAHV